MNTPTTEPQTMNTPALKISRDKNGNKTLRVKIGNARAFSIQTNGNLPTTHRDGIGPHTQPEIDAYLAATRPKPKPKKYVYLYVLQGHYRHSWEDLTAEDKAEAGAWSRIKETRKEYRENEGGAYRIISRREAATA
jgi:hypothetical protein